MRTKTLLLTAVLGGAMTVSSMAQVFSQNVVGYVNLNLASGFSLIANQLNGTDNTLSTILPSVPDSTEVLKWTGTRFADADLFIEGVGWVNTSTGEPSTTTVNPGEGFFINLPAAATVTLVGEVPQGSFSKQLTSGFNLVSHFTPQALGLSSAAASFPAGDSDEVLFWLGNRYADALLFIDGVGWVDTASGNPVDPTPAVGQGFFVNKAVTATWNRTFSVQ